MSPTAVLICSGTEPGVRYPIQSRPLEASKLSFEPFPCVLQIERLLVDDFDGWLIANLFIGEQGQLIQELGPLSPDTFNALVRPRPFHSIIIQPRVPASLELVREGALQ